jgi:hypothetical protein
MDIKTCTWNNVAVTVYYLDRGECIARHRHPVDHTTMVFAGEARVDIETHDSIFLTRHDKPEILPKLLSHEITSVRDGTIVVNMIAVENSGTPQGAGGIAHHDGTVTYEKGCCGRSAPCPLLKHGLT